MMTLANTNPKPNAGDPRQHALPKRWSNLLIVLAVVYCFLLLAGLSYAGWFRVA